MKKRKKTEEAHGGRRTLDVIYAEKLIVQCIVAEYCWFSLSRHSKIDQNKNQNRPIDKVQNLGNERR